MSVHKDHRKRVKSKVLNSEFSGFYDHEILEFLLFYAIPQKDTNPIAHELIKTFGSLHAVFEASYNDLILIDGISENSATLLKSIPYLSRAYLESASNKVILDSVQSTAKFLMPKYVGRTVETVMAIFLDNKSAVIDCKILFEGSVNSVNLDTRKIVDLCVKLNSSAIILSHNHPRGTPIPSSQDISTTLKLKEVLSMISIKLLDHIIIADFDYYSMSDSHYFKIVKE